MLVGVSILATALLVTWHPAQQAASVDPAITLRAE
jgi:ABC-type lipoprotein release transport system permease subunit